MSFCIKAEAALMARGINPRDDLSPEAVRVINKAARVIGWPDTRQADNAIRSIRNVSRELSCQEYIEQLEYSLR